ncbi:MAG: hypothetical protein R3290_03875 [Acidimicrobiia bacterium]|nr:hypothetical protein [Acidimicrobiia bacterium]
MLVRIRWFLFGVVATAWSGAMVLTRLVRVRERLTPQNVAREGTRMAADALDRLAETVAGREVA